MTGPLLLAVTNMSLLRHCVRSPSLPSSPTSRHQIWLAQFLWWLFPQACVVQWPTNHSSSSLSIFLPSRHFLKPPLTAGNLLSGSASAESTVTVFDFRRDLQGNKLAGQIPDEIGNCDSLIHMDLSDNQLYGDIPFSISRLKQLVFLNLKSNQLTGPIPSTLTQLPNLKTLDLAQNRLTGEIPRLLYWNEVLQYLGLRGNLLSGTLSPDICQLTGLWYLQLNDNQLVGKILDELGKLEHLFEFLKQLEEINVDCCDAVEYIIKEENATSESITFNGLHTIHLSRLPELECFSSGGLELQLPCLSQVDIQYCPSMEIFSQGSIKAEKLRQVRLHNYFDDEPLVYLKNNDLNSIIEMSFLHQGSSGIL